MSLSALCSRNAEKILGYLNTGVLSRELIPPHINFSHLSSQDYTEMYGVIKTVKEDNFGQLGLDACILEDELNKVRGRTFGHDYLTFLGLYCLHKNIYRSFRIIQPNDGGCSSSSVFIVITTVMNPLHPVGSSGHWPGLYRLHRGHDPLPRQPLLVRHVLLHADQLGPGKHDRNHDRYHHAHTGRFQDTQGDPVW